MSKRQAHLAYFARCKQIYGTPQEARDIELIQQLGYDVIPFTDDMQERAKFEGMDPFFEAVETAEVLIFRALPHGDIPAGVGGEIAHAQKMGVPVLELPGLVCRRWLDVEETRAYLRECGQR